MKNVYVGATITDAAIIRNLLLKNGIDCQLVEKSTLRHVPGGTEVWIYDDAQEAKASELIRDVLSRPPDERPWRCRKCRESNPANFEQCWACGTEHD